MNSELQFLNEGRQNSDSQNEVVKGVLAKGQDRVVGNRRRIRRAVVGGRRDFGQPGGGDHCPWG